MIKSKRTLFDIFIANWKLSLSHKSNPVIMLIITLLISIILWSVLKEKVTLFYQIFIFVFIFGFLKFLVIVVTVLMGLLSCIYNFIDGSCRLIGFEINDSEVIEYYQNNIKKVIPFKEIKTVLVTGKKIYLSYSFSKTIIISSDYYDDVCLYFNDIDVIIRNTNRVLII